MIDKIYSMIGLCMKAGKLAYGSDMCEEKLQYGHVKMIIIAFDASKKTKLKFRKLCENKVLYYEYGYIDELSYHIGKENKAIIGIMDNGFSEKIKNMIEESKKGAND